ncbi:C-terminal processing peptidase family protein [[Clostridium] bifermentans ATCC 638]|uniref:C-terminal processing peptidase family protein n=1 Tax=Paraclostridium bifermentans ATCC 638 = DSM 14991 TaxID=1233171 RepID=T4VJ47_PARBF|nr:S41 family peptidase [Paraclostridium bifermentans]EQK40801.1 C-terminal processing peptidase family protein [[Clostridium] bifermentans ATCC 638] [Paraclostridium bifermentans ATCC 638 = DSM 14991]UAG18379.1 S41 family peptidase [Paraclostridium bifermentans]
MISKKRAIIYSVIIVIATALITSQVVGFKYKGYDKIAGLKRTIDKDFYKDPDNEKLMTGSIKGMFESLDDPYSQYYTKEEFEKLQEQTSGSYVGIGVVIGPTSDDELITVVSPIEGSPAEKSGIKSGDKIIKVNGKEVTSKDMDKAMSLIKGKAGTDVKLTIKRGSEVLDINVKREEIVMKTIDSKVLENDIGYIKISSFDEHTYDDFKKALNNLNKKGIKGLVLDLRDNPGGLLNICDDIADEILPEGDTIVSVKDNSGKAKYLKSDNNRELDLPIALLINGGSASASEILTGAIVDNNRGIAIGTTTFGKGLVQTVRGLNDGTGYKLTTAQYYTPSGDYINKKGIKPKIEEKDENKQLQVAIDWMNNQINK